MNSFQQLNPLKILSKFISAILGTFFLSFTLYFEGYAQSQTEVFTAKNTVFVEVGGDALRYAASYGRIFHQKGQHKLSDNAGFSMWHFYLPARFYNPSSSTYWLPSLPLEVSAFLGKSNYHLEIGLGVTSFLGPIPRRNPDILAYRDKIVFNSLIPLRLGYRYQKPAGGYFFRVAYTPVFRLPINSEGITNFQPNFCRDQFGKEFLSTPFLEARNGAESKSYLEWNTNPLNRMTFNFVKTRH